MEYLDILDENGRPIGEKKSRQEVHTKGDWHNTVHVYIFRKINDEFEFLVHLRSKTKDSHPNVWDTRFGGHVKSSETIEDAVNNELQEEIGLKVKSSDLIRGNIIKHDGGNNREFVNIFYYQLDKADLLKFNDGEVQKVEWMPVEKIINSFKLIPEGIIGNGSGFKAIVSDLKKFI